MLPSSFSYFQSSDGLRLLAEASPLAADPLKAIKRLRVDFPADRVREAVGLVQLRKRAASKFSLANDMWFDRPGLEQASGESIARYRAKRFSGCSVIADLCCGIGGDTASLARVADHVIAVDRDPSRVGAARWNAGAHDVADRLQAVAADLETWLPNAPAAFFDPDRRADGRRRYAYADYRPILPLAELTSRYQSLGIKVAPGIPERDLPENCEVEFISDGGVCKEAVLWFGDLRTDAGRRATLLPGEHTITDSSSPLPPVRPPGSYLYEPDRAVIRAHLIGPVATHLDAWRLDPQIAYLSSDRLTESPFASVYGVTDVFRFGLKRLQAYLRERSIGQVTIKKRRFPLTPDELRAKLRLKGSNSITLVLTRIEEAPTVIVVEKVVTGPDRSG